MRKRVRFGSMYAEHSFSFLSEYPPSRSRAKEPKDRIHILTTTLHGVVLQMMMKSVNVECFFLFTFGTGNDDDDENLIVNVTEFVDSKVFSGGDGGDRNDDGSGNNNSAHPDAHPETPFQCLSSSVRNCIKTMGRCYLDILLFAPRSVKYVMSTSK
jgi:hypothetical protein